MRRQVIQLKVYISKDATTIAIAKLELELYFLKLQNEVRATKNKKLSESQPVSEEGPMAL